MTELLSEHSRYGAYADVAPVEYGEHKVVTDGEVQMLVASPTSVGEKTLASEEWMSAHDAALRRSMGAPVIRSEMQKPFTD